MELKIPLSDLDYGPEEENAVPQVLRSHWLTMGPIIVSMKSIPRLDGYRCVSRNKIPPGGRL